MPAPIHRFGRFRLDPARRALSRDGEPLTLASSTFDLIAYLVANADRAVGRDELGAAVWGRTDVSDTVLGQTVLKARRALGDDGRQQGAILTVPRFGYRWVVPLDTEPDEETASNDTPTPSIDAMAGAGPATDGTTAGVVHPDGAPVSAAFGDKAPPQPPALRAATPDTLVNVMPPVAVAQRDAAPSPIARPRPGFPASPRVLLLSAAVVLLVIVGIDRFAAPRDAARADTSAGVPAQTPSAPLAIAPGSALVLPARIEADPSFQWLRLGIMDLVTSRLREGGVAVLPSETVLGALGQPGTLAPGQLAADVLNAHVRHGVDQWTVMLEREGPAPLRVEATDADPIVAARRATDLWLVHLGRVPPPAVAAELEELLHRVRAATLSDQLALAHDLLDAAPPALRQSPALVHRRAQLALREGRYPEVEALVQPALAQVAESDQRVLRARLLVTLAAAELRQRKIDDAHTHYAAAADLLADGSDPATRGTALLGRGSSDALAERFDAAVADLGLARSELRSANDALGLAQVDVNLAQIARMRERPSEALPMLENARARFRTLGAVEELAFATVSIAEVQSELLDHRAALATVDTLWPPDQHVGNQRMRWTLTMLRARLLTNEGRYADASTLLDGIRRDADPQLDRMARARAASLAMQLAASRDDAAAMQIALDEAAAGHAADIDPCFYLRAQRERLAALRRAGQADTARDDLATTDTWANERRSLACIRVGLPLALAAGAEWTDARGHYVAALAEAERLGIPEALVEVAHEYVEALVMQGDLETAESVSGRVSPWADTDFRAASLQARVYGARGKVEAWRHALATAQSLAGERVAAAELLNVVR